MNVFWCCGVFFQRNSLEFASQLGFRALTHLAASVPHFLRIIVGWLQALARGVDPAQLSAVVSHKELPCKWKDKERPRCDPLEADGTRCGMGRSFATAQNLSPPLWGTCNYSHICTSVFDEPEGIALREGGHFIGRVFTHIFKATEGNASAVHHQLRQLWAQFGADLWRTGKLVSYLKHHTGLGAGSSSTDLGRILLRCVLDAVCDFVIRAGGETGVAAVLPQLSQVRDVLLPFYQDSTP